MSRFDPQCIYNGDTGLIWPDANGHMMAWFADGEGAVKAQSMAPWYGHIPIKK